MCGIIGAVSKRDIVPLLLDGLRQLEYRGYDSAGLAVVSAEDEGLRRLRTRGKVAKLVAMQEQTPLEGSTGIAHTRWATHGKPSARNAHPHISGDKVAVVHNGIIENYETLRRELLDSGVVLDTDTDSELIAHMVAEEMQRQNCMLDAVAKVSAQLHGAFAMVVASPEEPQKLVVVRVGSPLVIGCGKGENFIASDVMALTDVAQEFIILEEGDIAEVSLTGVQVHSLADGLYAPVERERERIEGQQQLREKGQHDTFMHKEIHEQPEAVHRALEARVSRNRVLAPAFGVAADELLEQVQSVFIVAAGSSYHCGLIAKYWIEELTGVSCQVEIASEFRYRKAVVLPNTLFVAVSQSGETADTLAALRASRRLGFLASLAICNVPTSTLVRESDMTYLMHAGPEFSVASTKAITCSLVGLLLMTLLIGRHRGLHEVVETEVVEALASLDDVIRESLTLESQIKDLAARFFDRHNAFFLGRGAQYPVALEAALKLKEISYVHAEGYPAGELKHGPLALVDEGMPVIAVAPKDDLIEKLQSNLREVHARGGQLIVFAGPDTEFASHSDVHIISMPRMHELLVPIVYSVPLQLLAYHVARQKGRDVDQPRNLAKAVTVE